MRGKISKMLWQWGMTLLLTVFAGIICAPVLMVITGSVMGTLDLRECLAPAYTSQAGFTTWRVIPKEPTLEHYERLLFRSPSFFVLFWNSMKMTGMILVGQLVIAVPAAWAFAVYKVKGNNLLFGIYVVLMLLPFQVTMLSGYYVLKALQLLDTQWAVVLPAIFQTLPIFIIYRGFCEIPKEIMEAARVDGLSEFQQLLRIGIPLGRGAMMSAMMLGFLEYWNMMEQPMAYIEEKALWPLSLYLSQISWAQAGYGFAASVITLTASGFVFAFGQEYLEQGILYAGLK